MTPKPLTDETRDTCLEAHDEIIRLRNDLAESASLNLKLKLALACVLPIAEQASDSARQKRICAYIRQTFGERPMPGKPKLTLVRS